MGTRERPVERGELERRRLLAAIGRELRATRRDRGLTQATVGRAAGCDHAKVSRLERGLDRSASVIVLARIAATLGLDLSIRTFPGGEPLREAGQARVLGRFHGRLHATVRWAIEVPFPIPGDRRAWDAVVAGGDWRYGVEAETHPEDAQALARRLQLKLRDGRMDGVLLVLPETRHVRRFLEASAALLRPNFPVEGRTAMARLAAGTDPGGSSIIVL